MPASAFVASPENDRVRRVDPTRELGVALPARDGIDDGRAQITGEDDRDPLRARKAGKALCIRRYIEHAMSLQQKRFRSFYWRSGRIPTVRYSFSEYTTGCLMAHCLPRSPVPMPRIAPPRLRW